MHHGIAGVVDGVLAKKDIDWMGNGIKGSVLIPAAEMGCVVGTRIRVYAVLTLLELLTLPCTRIAMIGRLGISRTLLASALWDAVVRRFDLRGLRRVHAGRI